MARVFESWLDPKRGRNAPINEFPSLYTMESHAGFCGAVFTGIWLGFAYKSFPELWLGDAQRLLYWMLSLAAVFFALAWVAMSAASYVNNRVDELRELDADNERRRRADYWARAGIALSSGVFMLVCCLLIWLTGGTVSPFTPFYVMIFTLTIERMEMPYPGFLVLLAYGLALLAACAFSGYNPLIDKSIMSKILASEFQRWITAFFLCMSLVVPTISSYFIQRTARRGRRPDASSADRPRGA